MALSCIEMGRVRFSLDERDLKSPLSSPVALAWSVPLGNSAVLCLTKPFPADTPRCGLTLLVYY